MISDEVDGPGYVPQYLWRLLIDQRYQGRGYGTAALDLIVEYFRGRPGVEVLWTSCGEGEGGPLGFYERYGFTQTGDRVFDNEILLRLSLRGSAPRLSRPRCPRGARAPLSAPPGCGR
jgi:diamine N-acetyltransferase